MSGSGMSERDYERHKRARDGLERDLVKSGVNPDKARKIATDTAITTDNKNKVKK
jgi:hypothetical protein